MVLLNAPCARVGTSSFSSTVLNTPSMPRFNTLNLYYDFFLTGDKYNEHCYDHITSYLSFLDAFLFEYVCFASICFVVCFTFILFAHIVA